MTIQRPDFSKMFDAQGNALASSPAETPSIEQTSAMIVRGERPSAEVSRSFGYNVAPTAPTPSGNNVVLKKNIDGQMRADWSQRNESGQFVTKSESEYRQAWDKEGGVAHVAQVVTAKE